VYEVLVQLLQQVKDLKETAAMNTTPAMEQDGNDHLKDELSKLEKAVRSCTARVSKLPSAMGASICELRTASKKIECKASMIEKSLSQVKAMVHQLQKICVAKQKESPAMIQGRSDAAETFFFAREKAENPCALAATFPAQKKSNCVHSVQQKEEKKNRYASASTLVRTAVRIRFGGRHDRKRGVKPLIRTIIKIPRYALDRNHS
jgi:hypothetical protein